MMYAKECADWNHFIASRFAGSMGGICMLGASEDEDFVWHLAASGADRYGATLSDAMSGHIYKISKPLRRGMRCPQ
jgi:hypothetical protein